MTARAKLRVVEEATPEQEPAYEPELRMVRLEAIEPHPHNLRREIGELGELAASIATYGLLEPLVLTPRNPGVPADEQVLVLIAGHRRKAAAVMAGLTDVPAIIRHDLSGEGQQVMAMLVENGRRTDLTPMEEAGGYQLLLEMDGLNAQKIAKAIGVPAARVRERIALTKLPAQLQEGVHGGQITLKQAAVLVEFKGDPAALKDLTRHLGSASFEYYVEQCRSIARRKQRLAEVRNQLKAEGIKVLDKAPDRQWEYTVGQFVDPEPDPEGQRVRFTAERHQAACQYHAVLAPDYGEVWTAICSDPEAAGHERAGTLRERDPAEQERARKIDERAEQMAIAAKLRREFIAALADDHSRSEELLRKAVTDSVHQLLETDGEPEPIAQALKVGVSVAEALADSDDMEPAFEIMAAAIAKLHLKDLVSVLFVIQALQRDRGGEHPYQWNDRRFQDHIDSLVGMGYALSPVEEEVRAEIAERRDSPAARQFEAEREATASEAPGEGVCRVCGCTDEQACEGGCHWVEDDLCSTCAAQADVSDDE